MRLRVEVARERLRSSNASETAVADLCGFKDVNEMETYFWKFHRTTPYKYRMEQQVT
jgi:transcriptional regulator GlxA family with amidase domain